MSPEKQRIAIAEACKHSFTKSDICPYCKGYTPYEAGDDYGITIWAKCETCNNTGKVDSYYIGLPDYPHDLNVMHKAEKTLARLQWVSYGRHLQELCDQSITWPLHATAAQRAEAFLKTINKWEDE